MTSSDATPYLGFKIPVRKRSNEVQIRRIGIRSEIESGPQAMYEGQRVRRSQNVHTGRTGR